MRLPAIGADLVRVNPSAGAHRVAVRASVSVAVPLLLLWPLGHVEWSIYAAFNAPTTAGVLLLDRGVETVIGVLIGLAIGYATRDRARSARGPDS